MRKVLIPLGVVALAIAAAAVGGRGEVAAAAPAACAKATWSYEQARTRQFLDRIIEAGRL